MERKRFLAVVMTVMMVISMIPSMVFAAAPSGELGGKLKIKGLAAVGVVVSADYAKVTPEEVTDEDFTFSWSRQTGEKELTQVGTEKTYTITQDDLGCRLVLDLTPVDGSGLTGTLTAKTLEVAATEEEAKAEDTQQAETADGTENAQLEETADNAEGSQDSENQDVDRTEDVQQNAGNEQEDGSQNTKGQPEETTEGTDDSQMKIYTEDQLQVDENGNVQTDGSEKDGQAAGEDDKDKKTYEATATVEDSEDQICDFGTVKSDLEDVEAQYVQITNTGNESLNFQEISPVQQNAGNEQEDESQNTKGQPEETTEGTDDSQMKIYTEDQLQVDENGNVQTDGSEKDGQAAGEDDKDKKTYEATATVEDSEDQICDFGTVKSDLEDVEAQYVQITNTGNESLNFQEISPEHFMVQDITEPLSAGESVSVWIQPREGLEPGEYDDMITYRTEEGIEVSFEAKIAVEGEDDSSDDEDLKPSDEPSAEPTETPDDSEAPSAGDNADASLEAQSLEVNTGSLNFSDIEENYTQANETLSVTVTNTGDGTVTLKIPKSDYFEVMNEDGSEAVSGIQIAKGDSLMFMVQPKTGLTKGDYSDTLIFESEEDSEVAAQVTAEVSVKEAEQEQITAVQADPESFSYDDLKEGYDTPEATTITLTNTGNTTVSLMQPYAEYFDIGELSASVLEPGDSAAFTAVPVTGLKVGNYLDSIQIAQTSSEGQEDVLTTIKASATVSEVKKIYKLSVTPEELNFGKAKEGYSEAPEAQKVTVTNEGNTNVTLNAPSGKNFKIGKLSATELAPGESCTFKIRPKEGLKAGSYTESVVIDNKQQISAEVKVQFTVKAARKAKIADPTDNKITGISSDGYTTQSKITFTAVGAGMDNESPGKGDVRYVPYNWKVINTNSWSSAPYTAAFGITKAGTYTLTVTFDRQKYNGSEWKNTGEQDTKQVNFSITQAQTVTATPTPQPNGATAKSAVKTGDTTNITPFVIILAIAAGCIVGVVVYKRRKK